MSSLNIYGVGDIFTNTNRNYDNKQYHHQVHYLGIYHILFEIGCCMEHIKWFLEKLMGKMSSLPHFSAVSYLHSVLFYTTKFLKGASVVVFLQSGSYLDLIFFMFLGIGKDWIREKNDNYKMCSLS